jgi:16S rRNA C1402 (ribose-2'-O) methylase RsmI
MPPQRSFTPALIEQLIRPLGLGSNVAPGWRLRRARISDDGRRIHYTLSPSELDVVVVERDDHAAALKRTASFNLYFKSESEKDLSPEGVAALRAMIGLIARNDTGAPVEMASQPATTPSVDESGDRDTGGSCTLHLVPGHVSNEGDLGERVWRALASSQHIFVEQGKESSTAALLERHGVETKNKAIIPIPYHPTQLVQTVATFRAAVERGENTCLFGVDDGIPAFCDPGREIVLEAARLGDRVRVKSLGGPSALAAALMRAETPIEGFTFAGILQYDPDVERFVPLLAGASASGLPLVFFAMGARLRVLLPALLGGFPDLRGRLSLYWDLTSERETIWHTELPGGRALPGFADDARVIVIITPAEAAPQHPGRA